MYAFYENVTWRYRILSSTNMEPYPAHWHSEIEVIVLIDGGLEMMVNDETYFLEAGDVCVMGTGEIHAYVEPKPNTSAKICFLNRETLGDHWDMFTQLHILNPILKKDNPAAKQIIEIVNQIERLKKSSDDSKVTGYKVRTLRCCIAMLALENMEWSEYSQEEVIERERKINRLRKILNYIDNHYQEEVTLESISDEMGFSPFYFSRIFRKATGTTFVKYLASVRIRHAMSALKKTDNLVSEIAYNVGFSSVKTFNRIFKEVNGVSPLEYKKAALRDNNDKK